MLTYVEGADSVVAPLSEKMRIPYTDFTCRKSRRIPTYKGQNHIQRNSKIYVDTETLATMK